MLVAGATGGVGAAVVRQLVAQGIPVKARQAGAWQLGLATSARGHRAASPSSTQPLTHPTLKRKHMKALVRDGVRAAAKLPSAAEIVEGDVYKFSTLPAALAGW